jgi:hypothetical protein
LGVEIRGTVCPCRMLDFFHFTTHSLFPVSRLFLPRKITFLTQSLSLLIQIHPVTHSLESRLCTRSAPTTNIMHLFNTILFCSALVAAAPRVLSNTNSINQLTRRTALLNETLPRMSNDEAKAFVGKECWADGRVKWPVNDLPPPSVNKDSQQLSVFDSPATTPGSLTVHNYCNYDIHYRHEGQDNVLHANGVLSAGTSYIAPVSGLGQVWKGSKTADMGKVVLAEYSVQANNDIWYNLSLVKCLGVGKDGQYTTDTSACAGHEAGLQFGNQGFKSFQCAPGLWCDDQAYLYDVSHLHLR